MSQNFRCGWVALVGPPNAGKSTLLNSLLGQKISIVTARPQTTRNRIVGILTEDDAQLIFMDTPGLHHQRSQMRGPMGKAMLQAAWQSLNAADCILMVLDADLYVRKPEFLDRDIAALTDALADETRPVVVVVNKVDLFHDKAKMLPLLETLHAKLPHAEIFPLSALQKDGLPDFKKLLKTYLPQAEAQFPEDQVSTAPLRFLAAEIVREKVFERLRQEVPYTTAVDVEAWKEFGDQTEIHAVIYVARPSHKAMVIGRAGATIKAVGIDARKELQTLIGGKVHLELWVKVKDNWTTDPNFLHELGLGRDSEIYGDPGLDSGR